MQQQPTYRKTTRNAESLTRNIRIPIEDTGDLNHLRCSEPDLEEFLEHYDPDSYE